ncbi:MAG: hypothetical protein SCK57_14595 [Bacillota bacterium]|nr:hypothetical protein [Bacillota bacterium]MDW7678877.1 hypothetical protein [Bacillota bacterium]
MPMTNIIAKVKKIDIANRVLGEDWKQTITLTLGEIELKNENLIAIRQFRPNEEVLVNLKSLQLSLGDLPAEQKGVFLDRDTDVAPVPEPESRKSENERREEADVADFDLSTPLIREGSPIEVKVFEDGEDDVDPASIVKSFTF